MLLSVRLVRKLSGDGQVIGGGRLGDEAALIVLLDDQRVLDEDLEAPLSQLLERQPMVLRGHANPIDISLEVDSLRQGRLVIRSVELARLVAEQPKELLDVLCRDLLLLFKPIYVRQDLNKLRRIYLTGFWGFELLLVALVSERELRFFS